MKSLLFQKINSYLILLAGVLSALIITPSYSTEPVDMPKMVVLVPFGLALLALIVLNVKKVWKSANRLLLVTSALFIFQMILVLRFSGAPFLQQFYGTFGRNTGFLSYLVLLIILLSSSLFSDEKFAINLSKSLLFLGFFSIIYSLLQTYGSDPIKWNNPYNPIIGFLGNPDFESSFLGLCGVVAFTYILQSGLGLTRRLAGVFFYLTSLFLIFRSHAQQGLLVLAFGTLVTCAFYMKSNPKINKKLFNYPAFGIGTIGSVLVILGTLNIGPLASHLYKLSVRQRGFYWHAALEMMKRHPLFGVGFDSYGDWYFKYRSLNAAFHTPVTQSNAAHNVFLDIGASGGFILFFLNLALTGLALWSIIRIFRKASSFNWGITALIGAWFAYEAQSIVSINQLGLAVWGWILTGAIIGYEYRLRDSISSQTESEASFKNSKRTRVANRKKENNQLFGVASIGFVIGCIFVFPVYINDLNYRQATQSRNASSIVVAALKSPEDIGRTLSAAQLFASNKLPTQALELAKHVISIDPRSFNAWTLVAQVSQPGSSDYIKAIEQLKVLNPQVKN